MLRYSHLAHFETRYMSNAVRWTREFSTAYSFADDLGALGTWVGPRTGAAKRTRGQKEDYVLRRVLVALRRQGELDFPFVVCATDQAPGLPDYVFRDSSGRWGLEVTEAGSERHQEAMTSFERQHCVHPADEHVEPFDDGVREIRRAIKRKNSKFDSGDYRGICECDLAVYDNTNSCTTGHAAVGNVNDPSLAGRFRRVFFVRDRHVYADVLCDLGDQPDFLDLSRDYNIDFAEWVHDQVNLLRTGEMSRLDVEELIEELSDLARSQRRALRSHLRNLLLHLLKWQFQQERRSTSWQRSIDNARDEIDDLLMESPSIRDEFADIGKWYLRARRDAAREMELPVDDLPQACPFDLEREVLLDDWFPAPMTRKGD